MTKVQGTVCLVIGAGRGIGANVAAKFAANGFISCLVRRSKPELLQESVNAINKQAEGSAKGFLCDATKQEEIEKLVAEVEANVGPIKVLIYNLGANMGIRNLTSTTPEVFHRALSLGVIGGF